VGSYIGRATLIDDRRHAPIGDAMVTLASVDTPDEAWFGNLHADPAELAGLVADGDRLVIRLPTGLEGRVQVTIDLTGPDPTVHLRGIGQAPI